jgi:ribosomal protein S18 acetylase RimI-like enzyme
VTIAFTLEPVTDADFEPLLVLRIATMRESLERLGRFDAVRARERFRQTFRPADTRQIVVGGRPVGCVAFWLEAEHAMRVEHFYIDVAYQRRGLGGSVLAALFASAPASTRVFRVGALRESDADRFYRRHGFVTVWETQFDIAYERLAR